MPLLIPFNDDPSNEFTTQLGGVKYTFETRYNEGPTGEGGFWTFDMTKQPEGVKLLSGTPILLGQDLIEPYALGIGGFIPIDEDNTDVDAGPDDLGVRVNVYYFTVDELAEAKAAAVASE